MTRNRKPRVSVASSNFHKTEFVAEPSQQSAWRSTPARFVVVLFCTAGLLSGAALSTILFPWERRPQVLYQNSLLMSQQINEIFAAVEQQIIATPEDSARYEPVLEVFYAYDRRFVELNEAKADFATECNLARQRLKQVTALIRKSRARD